MVTFLVGCHDFATAPRLEPPQAAARMFSCDPNCSSTETQADGSYDGEIELYYGYANEKPTPTAIVRHPTFMRVKVSGLVTQNLAAG